jgi:hypothetical protein
LSWYAPLPADRYLLYSSKSSLITLDNQEIRPRILGKLYEKYFEDGIDHPIDTEQVVADAGIPPENYELAYTNVNYLEGGFLIKGVKPVGHRYPKWISITPQGITTVESKAI